MAAQTDDARRVKRRQIVAVAMGALVGAALGAATLYALFRPSASLSRAKPAAADTGTPGAGNQSESERADSGAAAAAKRPEHVRAPKTPPRKLAPYSEIYDWPKEPPAPSRIDDARFTEALVLLCGPHADREVRTWYAEWMLQYCRLFGSDPFLLGALTFAQSGCQKKGSRHGGLGLTGLYPELYQGDVHGGQYRYRAFVDGHWVARTLTLDKFPLNQEFAAAPESNLYFAAAFLRAWREQQRGLFVSFVQQEYRHHVSHFVWGDKVLSRRHENRILADRRRILEYYGAIEPRAPVKFRGHELGCPLDGCPRLATSILGDAREGGKRAHRGVDFESTRGEPVRAVADGKVVFAGVDMPGKAAHIRVPIYAQRSIARSIMGAGGLYVCIQHGAARSDDALTSCYMHLESATVSQGREVKRGDEIGRVGRTGIKVSAPHLHFELHAKDGVHGADKAMPGLVIGKPPVDALPAHGAPG